MIEVTPKACSASKTQVSSAFLFHQDVLDRPASLNCYVEKEHDGLHYFQVALPFGALSVGCGSDCRGLQIAEPQSTTFKAHGMGAWNPSQSRGAHLPVPKVLSDETPPRQFLGWLPIVQTVYLIGAGLIDTARTPVLQ